MTVSALTIEELTGKKRRVVLMGGGLPLKGAKWAGATTVATTWNNGNPEATQQVLTSQELPSDWQGVWRTPQLIGTPCEYEGPEGFKRVGLASDLERVFESLRIAGQLLRVTWANEVTRQTAAGAAGEIHAFSKVRLGRLTEFESDFETLDDIRWSMTFEWTSRGDVTPKTIDFRGDNLIASVRSAIQQQDAVTKAVYESTLRGLKANGFRNKNYASPLTLGQLESVSKGLVDTVDSFSTAAGRVTQRLKAVGDLILSARAVPFEVAGHALDVANNAVAIATAFMDEVSQKPPEQQVLDTKLSTLTRTASYSSRVQTQAQLMQAATNRLAQQARLRRSGAGSQSQPIVNSTKSGDIMEVYLPRAGDTMVSIAIRFYQTDTVVGDLCKVNGLPRNTIKPPRQTLVIPTRSVLEARTSQSA